MTSRRVQLERFPFKKLVVFSIIINVLTVVFILAVKNRLPPEVPLFYGRPTGEEQLSTTLGLAIPAVVSFFILFINIGLSLLFTNDFLKKTLILSGISSVAFSTITTVKIIFLIGSF